MQVHSRSIQVGDAVIAVGQLGFEGHQLYFEARGEGTCDEDLQASQLRLPVSDSGEPQAPIGKKITIRATWTGAYLDGVVAVADRPGPTYPTESFGSPTFNPPPDRTEKTRVFSQEFIAAAEAAYDDALVGILAFPLSDGWVGLLGKHRGEDFPATLQKQIKPWHVIVESPWGHRRITELNDYLTHPATEAVRTFGGYWDNSGTYRVFFLVPYLKPEMAAVLSQFPDDMYRVISWLEKAK